MLDPKFNPMVPPCAPQEVFAPTDHLNISHDIGAPMGVPVDMHGSQALQTPQVELPPTTFADIDTVGFQPPVDHTQWSPDYRKERGLSPDLPREVSSFELQQKHFTPQVERRELLPVTRRFDQNTIPALRELPDLSQFDPLKNIRSEYYTSAGKDNEIGGFESLRIRDIIDEPTFKNKFGDDKKIGGDIHTTIDVNPNSPTFGEPHQTLELPGSFAKERYGLWDKDK
jgi:hypothetical protein